MDALFHGAEQRRRSVLRLGPCRRAFLRGGALWRAANEFMDTFGAFELVETIAKRVVEINGRTDCLQTCNDLEGHAAVVGMFQVALVA